MDINFFKISCSIHFCIEIIRDAANYYIQLIYVYSVRS